MYKTASIANYFIEKGIQQGTPVNPMKLQKIMYYAYGWYYGYFKKKLFEDDIQAWKYGPVIETVYHDVKEYGNYPIEAPITKILFGDGTKTFGISYGTPKFESQNDEDSKFIETIWNAYSKYHATQLSDSTHADGTPWDIVAKKYEYKIPK